MVYIQSSVNVSVFFINPMPVSLAMSSIIRHPFIYFIFSALRKKFNTFIQGLTMSDVVDIDNRVINGMK